jgi:hypothetical protein
MDNCRQFDWFVQIGDITGRKGFGSDRGFRSLVFRTAAMLKGDGAIPQRENQNITVILFGIGMVHAYGDFSRRGFSPEESAVLGGAWIESHRGIAAAIEVFFLPDRQLAGEQGL